MTEKDIRKIFQPGNVFGFKAFQKLIDFIVSRSGGGSGGGSAFEDYAEGGGDKTREEFLPAFVESVDNSELLFILPEGTQFPYTLTSEDKAKLEKVYIIIANTGSFIRSNIKSSEFYNISNSYTQSLITVTETQLTLVTGNFVDNSSIHYTAQSLSDEQKTQARTNIDAEKATIVENVEGTEVTLDVKGGRKYMCGELISLTINSIEKSIDTTIIYFTSGATKTQFIYPENTPISGWDEPEENKTYTICVFNGNLSIEPYE